VKRILLTACVLVAAMGPLQAQSTGDEQRLKAAFVFRFPQFVVWPPAAIMGRNSLEICASATRSADALREITAGELLNGKPFRVRETPSARDLRSCHVLVLTGAQPDRSLMTTAASLPILTVGDSDSFLDRGGIIQLKVVDRRIRFEIDQKAAARAGLTLSSQLLRLAANVRSDR
jgi:hypothetical protein